MPRKGQLGLLPVLFTAFSLLVLLLLWEWSAIAFSIPRWLCPRPSDFLMRLASDRAMIIMHTVATSRALIEGFMAGVLVAIPLALILTSNNTIEWCLYPVIVFLNIMPKTVVGPALIVWFGIGSTTTVTIVFLMCFFPILVDAMAGFRSVDRRLLYISRTMGATALQSFWKIRAPAASRSVLSGMKIGVVKAADGVIVAEFIASDEGLGFMILSASGKMDISLLFAGLFAAACVALFFNGAVAILGTIAVPRS